MDNLYFSFASDFDELIKFLDNFCWDANGKVEVIITKESNSWEVCIKDVEE